MKLWGGRFQKTTDKLVEDFHSSISFDKRLYHQDIKGSIAHARMLGQCGVIEIREAEQIIQGLKEILEDIEQGKVEFDIGAEDIHMNVEKILTERIGAVGKKLHTGRSRNDQVALDIRMYLKDMIGKTQLMLLDLAETILELAGEHAETWMPGYTHMQRAQPISFGHHIMAYFYMFMRDVDRLTDCFKRSDVMPLGSGALAGTTFPIDREMVRAELGFSSVTLNSMDGVSDRDFAIEFTASASIIMMHLSRLCEELIIWSTGEFGFVTMDDAYSTGSSIMPQKKNPDVAELVRGKAGRVYGDLMALLTMMKGLPLAYNKDMQEDKEALFDAVDTVQKCLLVTKPMLKTLQVNKEKMAQGAKGGFTNATDVADYLAKKGVPFREAHEIVGKLVLSCSLDGRNLEDLDIGELQAVSPVFGPDIYSHISVEHCVKARQARGGPSPHVVLDSVQKGRETVEGYREKISKLELE